jgi:hypothetical protein
MMTGSRNAARIRWAPADLVSQARDRRRAQLASAEFLRLAGHRANVLLTGSDRALAFLLDALHEHLRQPLTWCSRRMLVLPRGGDGTLLIHDLEALTREQQDRLFDWLTRRTCRTQIVSMSANPLLPRVCAGTFVAGLFYRLNVISLDLT